MTTLSTIPLLAEGYSAAGVQGGSDSLWEQTSAVFWFCSVLQLCIALGTLRLQRRFGVARLGLLFWVFSALAIVNLVQFLAVDHGITALQINLELVSALICVLLLLAVVHLISALGEQARSKLAEERTREALESEVEKKTRHLNQAIVDLEAQVEECKRVEEQLREQAQLVDLTHDAIIVQDLSGRVLFWNKAAERTYGWSAPEARGRMACELWTAEALTFALAQKTALQSGRWHGEASVSDKNGKKLLVDSDWILVRDAQGAPKSIMIVSTDITDQRKLEVQTLRSQRLESIGTLASGIAHDLNNMLTPLLIAIQLLRDKGVPRDQQKLLDTMRGCVLRGARLIKQILSFSRGIQGERVKVRLAQVTQEIRQMVQDTFPKSVAFECRIPNDLWTVTGDATQIHQVLLNLLVNARDAMPKGGRLTLRMENVVVDELYASKNPEAKPGAFVLISVSDTGTGIPDDIITKIFEPFFTTKDQGRGTGLGLSTCFTIVKSHGGFINVYSELNKGSAFKVYLPAQLSEASRENQIDDFFSLPRGNGELVLVVDDEPTIRDFASLTLEHFGYRVLVAANGAEAVSTYLLQQNKIAVVITDRTMPIMDGPSMISTLKALNPKVRIIETSGLEPVPGEQDSPAPFISKPYTTDVLLVAIHHVLHPLSEPCARAEATPQAESEAALAHEF